MGAFVSERIPVEPRILRWAREFAGLPEEEAARRIGVSAEKLSDWEEGVSSPTINQLRTMADRYRLSFGVFLLRQPPARKFIPPHDFRRVQGPPLPRSIELMTQLRLAVERRQLAPDHGRPFARVDAQKEGADRRGGHLHAPAPQRNLPQPGLYRFG